MTIKNKREFLALIERLDEEFSDTPLAGRSLVLLCNTLRQHPAESEFPLLPDARAVPGDYTGPSLYAHIKNWCDERYGSKQNIPIETGRVVFELRGNRWEVQVPLVFIMRKKFVVTYELDGPPDRSDGEFAVINMRRFFVDLPLGLAEQLQSVDLKEERNLFSMATCAINQLRQCEDLEFVSAALADFRLVGPELAKQRGAFGHCRWSTLQFIEKSLKAYIAFSGATVEFTHDLLRLASKAHELGMPILDQSDLNLVQCGAGVRYGKPVANAQEAMAAHHASVRLAYTISRALAVAYDRSLTKAR